MGTLDTFSILEGTKPKLINPNIFDSTFSRIYVRSMPNRSCDFCLNQYRHEPNVGYYKVTNFMKIKLDMLDVRADYICGIHFKKDCFLENGRLTPNACPSFFPSKANLSHDHPYFCEGEPLVNEGQGKELEIGKYKSTHYFEQVEF